jgi:hypothetical protein
MTSQASAEGRFTLAIQRRNLFQAELVLREMRDPSLLVLVDYLELLADVVRTSWIGPRSGGTVAWKWKRQRSPLLNSLSPPSAQEKGSKTPAMCCAGCSGRCGRP